MRARVFPWRTLQFGFHGDVREAPQHGDDLVVLLLDQEAQHAASLRVLQTHQVLQAPHLVLQHTGGGDTGLVRRNASWDILLAILRGLK